MKKLRGFTLIELLTVIAIIAILAAIITPVYVRAKVSANRASDISAMNQLSQALQLYRVDQGGYPPALLGYETLYTSGANAGNVIPANGIAQFLFPKRVDNVEIFKPKPLQADYLSTVTAVWPNQDPRAVGAAAYQDVDGDGNITPADDPAKGRQFYGPNTPVYKNPIDSASGQQRFYKVSGYDVAEVGDGNGGKRTELRYTLFWSEFGLTGGASNDDTRQLGYNDPADSTVITWDSFYRDYDSSGAVKRQNSDMVLYVGGSARAYDSADMFERSWRANSR